MPDAAYALRQIDIAREAHPVLGECPSVPGSRRHWPHYSHLNASSSRTPAKGRRHAAAVEGRQDGRGLQGRSSHRGRQSWPSTGAPTRSRSAVQRTLCSPTADAVRDLEQCKFVDLHEAVQKALGERVPDYHIHRPEVDEARAGSYAMSGRCSASQGRLAEVATTKAWKRLEAES